MESTSNVIESKFAMMNDQLDLTCDFYVNSLIICGSPGIGKTKEVLDFMEKSAYHRDAHWIYKKGGSISRFGLYSFLYDYRDEYRIILDDIDNFLSNKSFANMLKGALDTNDRMMSWISTVTYNPDIGEEKTEKKQYPNNFQFNSVLIFLTNLSPASIDPAVKNRSVIIDMRFSRDEIYFYIKNNLDNVNNFDLSNNKKLEVLDYLYERKDIELSFRTLIEGMKNMLYFPDRWKQYIDMMSN